VPGYWRRRRPSWAFLVLGTGSLLAAGTSFAASDSRATQRSVASVQVDHESEALLLKVEKQISDGHTTMHF
jgi:anti-sigma factor RsiW